MAILDSGNGRRRMAFAPRMAFAVRCIEMGVFSIPFTSLTNTILQIEAAPTTRGPVISLWSVAFRGTTLTETPTTPDKTRTTARAPR